MSGSKRQIRITKDYSPGSMIVMKKPSKRSKKRVSVNEVKGIARSVIKSMAEKKYWTINALNTIDFNGTVTRLTAVPQGDTDLARDGDQLQLTSWQLRFAFVVGDAYNIMRIIIFRWDMDDSEDTPTAPEILFNVGSTNSPLSSFNQDSIRQKQMRILYDKLVTIDTYNPIKVFKIKKRNSSKISFSGGTTNGTGHLYMLVVSDSGAVTHPAIAYDFKCNFIDL